MLPLSQYNGNIKKRRDTSGGRFNERKPIPKTELANNNTSQTETMETSLAK